MRKLRLPASGETPITTANDIFGISTAILRREDLTDVVTPYQNKAGTTATNLLSALSDAELEKGILFNVDTQSMEVLTAAAANIELADDDAEAVIEKTETTREADDSIKSYRTLMSNVCEYLYQLNRYNRSATVTTAGHRWMVPGWPCIIFDSDIPHVAHVNSINFAISVGGYQTTSTSLSRVRPVPNIDIKLIREIFDAISASQQTVDENKAEVINEYEAKIDTVGVMLAKALELLSAMTVVDSSVKQGSNNHRKSRSVKHTAIVEGRPQADAFGSNRLDLRVYRRSKNNHSKTRGILNRVC